MVGRQALKQLKELYTLDEAINKLQVNSNDCVTYEPNRNRFQAFEELDQSDQLNDDNEVQSKKVNRKCRHKRRNTKKNLDHSSEEDIIPNIIPCKEYTKSLYLPVYSKFLNYQNEFSSKFGIRKVHRRDHLPSILPKRYHIFVIPQENISIDIPIIMERNEDDTFKFVHMNSYQKIEQEFLLSVSNQEEMLAFMQNHPNHLNSLLQMTQLFRLQEDNASVFRIMDHCISLLQSSLHPEFKLHCDKTKSKSHIPNEIVMSSLPYKFYENRIFHIILFRHAWFLHTRCLSRTALEICKVLLNIDSEDPLATILMIDIFAIKSKEYQFLVDFYEQHVLTYHLDNLPGMMFHYALALFELQDEKASSVLAKAVENFPGTLYLLLDRLSIQTDTTTERLLQNVVDDPTSLRVLSFLFVDRICQAAWSSPSVLLFLENSTKSIHSIKENNSSIYEGFIPTRVRRHIVLSDLTINSTSRAMETLQSEKGEWENKASHIDQMSLFNPFPPSDILGSYKLIPEEPKRSILNMFVESLVPTPSNNGLSLLEQLRQTFSGFISATPNEDNTPAE